MDFKPYVLMLFGNALLTTVICCVVVGAILCGFGISRLLGLGPGEQRTISIEVGMQNSGLGSSLASTPAFAAQFSSALQASLAPVPSAISAVYHVVLGSLLASIWRRSAGD